MEGVTSPERSTSSDGWNEELEILIGFLEVALTFLVALIVILCVLHFANVLLEMTNNVFNFLKIFNRPCQYSCLLGLELPLKIQLVLAILCLACLKMLIFDLKKIYDSPFKNALDGTYYRMSQFHPSYTTFVSKSLKLRLLKWQLLP